MAWNGVPYITPLFLAFIISITLIILTWFRRPSSGALSFSLIMLAIAIWSLGSSFELLSPTLLAKVFWSKVEYIGIVSLPVTWLVLAIEYSGQIHWLKPRYIVWLTVEPLITLALVWTNEYHQLFWSSVRISQGIWFPVMQTTFQNWFWIHSIYSYLLLSLGTILLFQVVIHVPGLYRGQVKTLLAGLLFPCIVNILYIFKLKFILDFDLTPFAFSITGIIIAWGFLQFHLFDIVPVARDAVVENMSDLVIVVDLQGRIVDVNTAARQVITHSTTSIIGQKAVEVLAAWPELVVRFQEVYETEAEITLIEDDAEHHFDLRISPLYNQRGRHTGRLIILRDITERKRAEKLQVNLVRLQKTMEETIQAMALMVELKDSYTAGHQRRVAKLALALGKKMGFSESQLDALYMAAVVHDIGKIAVPSEILNKPGRLTDAEFTIIKTHPTAGYNILKMIEFPWPIAQMVLQHHERINGSGYPNGLLANAILLEAKIIAVADVVESMSTDRPYRLSLGINKALAEISQNRGMLYDSLVVDTCTKLFIKDGYDFEVIPLQQAF